MASIQVVNMPDVDGQKALTVSRDVKAGEVVVSLAESVPVPKKSRYSVQVGANDHIILKPDDCKFLNHSCDPNVFLDTENLQLVALKDLKVGEYLTFFYPSTEWDMAEPFKCVCESKNCLKEIRGAKFINGGVIGKFRLNKHIRAAVAMN